MRVDKETVDETKVDSESLDFDDIRSATSLPERVLSLLYSNQAKVNATDTDRGCVRVAKKLLARPNTPSDDGDVNREIKLFEHGLNGRYDREALLYELANSENPEIFKLVETFERRKRISNNSEDRCSIECQKLKVERLRESLQALPDSLLHLYTGVNRNGDCGRPSDRKPDWLDPEKFRQGQKFAQDHSFSVHFAELISLFALLSFQDTLKPVIVAGEVSTPFAAFKRYLTTGIRLKHWYTQDLWDKRTAANKDISIVKAMHVAVRRRLDTTPNEEIDAAAKIPNAWCPTRDILLKDFAEACEEPVFGQCPYAGVRDNSDRHASINQCEMATTQWGFVGLIVSYPKLLGVHYATDEDLEAFIHLWRSIGYQLGIEDEYNFCRGTLEDVRQRSHDYLHSWVKPNFREITPEWEHMMRCLVNGLSAVMPGATYETALLYLAEILNLPMPRLYASLSYKEWVGYNIMKFFLRYTIKIPGIASLMNGALDRLIDRAEKFTPEDIETIRNKLSSLHPEKGVATNDK